MRCDVHRILKALATFCTVKENPKEDRVGINDLLSSCLTLPNIAWTRNDVNVRLSSTINILPFTAHAGQLHGFLSHYQKFSSRRWRNIARQDHFT